MQKTLQAAPLSKPSPCQESMSLGKEAADEQLQEGAEQSLKKMHKHELAQHSHLPQGRGS